MPRFTTVPVADVLQQRKERGPSKRAQTQQQYQEALRNALIHRHEALVVDLEDGDKPLTIRNRLTRAAEALGLENVTIRRRGDRIVAYQEGVIDEGTQTGEGSPAILEREGVAS